MTHTEERKTAWTPGPWQLGSLGGAQHLYRIVRTSDRESVARVMCNGEEGQANAHLIAAAPLLYGALAESKCHGCNVFIGEPTVADCGMCRTKRAALAAARGEAS